MLKIFEKVFVLWWGVLKDFDLKVGIKTEKGVLLHSLIERREGSLTRAIFAHKIARKRQSLFGQKCAPDPRMQAFEWRIRFLISYKTQKTESIDSVFRSIYIWEGSLRELNSSRSSRASTERPFAEFAHPILECEHSSDRLNSSPHTKPKRESFCSPFCI